MAKVFDRLPVTVAFATDTYRQNYTFGLSACDQKDGITISRKPTLKILPDSEVVNSCVQKQVVSVLKVEKSKVKVKDVKTSEPLM